MFSSLRARFGKKPTPDFRPPTVERTQWFVNQPLHSVTFEDKDWAFQWCAQHGLGADNVQERTLKLNAEQETQQNNALNNLFERVKEGFNMGSMATIPQNVSPKHLDGFFESFKAQPQIDATTPLLALAFSVNRVDVAHYIGGLLERSFEAWQSPYESVPYQDPEIVDNANKAFYQGFTELMAQPRQMQWLFENNPSLLAKVTSPLSWAKLEEAVPHMANAQKLMWPTVAHTVFDRLAHPVAAHWPLNDPDAFNKLTLSFAHDPAAQCCLMLQTKTHHWFAEHDLLDISPTNASIFVCRESLALRDHLRHVDDHTYEQDVQTRVSLLEMGLDETTRPEEFYQHARAVFSPPPTMELLLPELDSPNHL